MVDRGLMDLVSVYRDAIAMATGAPGTLVNEEIRGDVEQVARTSTPELNLQRIAAIFAAREQMLEFNVPVALALESMMVALKVAGPGPRMKASRLIAGLVVIALVAAVVVFAVVQSFAPRTMTVPGRTTSRHVAPAGAHTRHRTRAPASRPRPTSRRSTPRS